MRGEVGEKKDEKWKKEAKGGRENLGRTYIHNISSRIATKEAIITA